MMAGLRTWWQAAVGTSALHLHLSAGTLALRGPAVAGGGPGRHGAHPAPPRGSTPARALLAGEVEAAGQGPPGRLSRVVAPGAAALAALALIAGAAGASTASPGTRAGLFFAAGALLLAGRSGPAVAVAETAPGGLPTRPARSGSLAAAGARNIRRQPGRSLTAVSLVACAVFVIAAVGAHRPAVTSDSRLPPGAGGFYGVVAESDLPVHGDLNDAGVRRGLGLPASLEASSGRRPHRAAALAAGRGRELPEPLPARAAAAARGAAGPDREGPLPLRLPPAPGPAHGRQPLAAAGGGPRPGVVAAVADANSAQWILHRGLGEEIAIEDAAGRPVRLRLVALLRRSILQSELLISEAAFERLFPERTGYGFFLVETPDEARVPALIAGLERGLRDFGFDAAPAADRLARFLEIETTYLSTFQSLGGLGLLLGTVGLGLLLLRNAFERRRELAALQAFGFRRRRLARLLFWETGLLLLGGIGLAAAVTAAAVASLPHLGPRLPWASLGSTLGLVLAAGWLGNAAAVRLALRRDLLPALKGE